MNNIADYIKQRLSLREPLKESLDILVNITDNYDIAKNPNLNEAIETINRLYPSCTDFEREFPSICFSIATGVGKTRLMGAFIAYMYLKKGIRNFFILAPNLTIYDKLIEDFGNPANPKYVFNGIAEFVHNRPIIITGDNYAQQGRLLNKAEVRINVFNISKFNTDTKTSKKDGKSLAPKIKRLSEYLGQSYWEYLSNLDDLVILMDEAHRYHADASKSAINELRPVLGLELTATPIDEKGKQFKNLVYEYSLAKALAEGKYVKEPCVSTRKDFNPANYTEDELEKIKLEDAISIHDNTKIVLELYSVTKNVKKVKPFIFVICKDTTHSAKVYDYVVSDSFYDGKFKDKVLRIDSTTKTDEVEKLFVTLENPDNAIEIVIHVNMLKEGWDVTNLYTIVPLRAANAEILIEQTIGRGLRLPYNGERTGVEEVDRLTVLAHDNFNKIIEAAKDKNSVLNKISTYQYDENDIKQTKILFTARSKNENEIITAEKEEINYLSEAERVSKKQMTAAKKALFDIIPLCNKIPGVSSFSNLKNPEIKQIVLEKVKSNLYSGQTDIFAEAIIEEVETSYNSILDSYRQNIIEIPKLNLRQSTVDIWFEDFDLNTDEGFSFKVLKDKIHIQSLTTDEVSTVDVLHGAYTEVEPISQIILELVKFPEIDYDSNTELLVKLTKQALEKLESNLEDNSELPALLKGFRKLIAENIYNQLKKHLRTKTLEYLEPEVLPFEKIENWHFTGLSENGLRNFKDIITPVSLIPKLVFGGFKKACHIQYKFDSKTEKDFATVCENDKDVLKWLRPAEKQFRIYWDNNSKLYHPDFVVETAENIFMVETKARDEINSDEVQNKKNAGLNYCTHVNNYLKRNGSKLWRYLLIPHDDVTTTNTFAYFINKYNLGPNI